MGRADVTASALEQPWAWLTSLPQQWSSHEPG